MKVKIKFAIRSLKSHWFWIKNLGSRGTEATKNKAADIITGCLDLMEYSGTDMEGWMNHRSYRFALDRPEKAVWTKGGRRAALELIDLTISDLAACDPFRPEVEAGILPVSVPSGEKLESLEHVRGASQKQS